MRIFGSHEAKILANLCQEISVIVHLPTKWMRTRRKTLKVEGVKVKEEIIKEKDFL